MIEIVPNFHPWPAHFAIALPVVAAGLFIASMLVRAPATAAAMTHAARWNLWIGTVFAALAVLTGLDAYATVEHDAAGHEAMRIHRLWALLSLALLAVATALSLGELRRRIGATAMLIALCVASAGALTVTGHLGARNVYVHGIGVQRLPDPDDHAHHHGGHDEHEPHRHGNEAPGHANGEGHEDENRHSHEE